MAARRKPKRAPDPPEPLPNDPTPERLRRDTFATIPAPRFADEVLGRDALRSTRRRVPPLERMTAGADPWLDKRQVVALERYELLIEQAGFDAGSKGCLAPGSGGGGNFDRIADLRYEARKRLARAANYISDADQTALMMLNILFAPTNQETVTELARRLCRHGLPEAKTRIRRAASAAAEYFQGI